jgi:PAS domain S-box-containing protein
MPTRDRPTRSASRSARLTKPRKLRATQRRFRAELKIVLAYALVAVLWILFSDRALRLLISEPQGAPVFPTQKGLAFVGITAVFLYLFIRRELSRRRKITEALRQSEARLLLAQEIGRIGSWDVDLTDITLHWSAETFRIFQRDPLTFVPTCEAFLEMVHPADKRRMREAAEEVIRADKDDLQAEHRIIWPNGAERHVLEHARIFRDSTGQPIRMIGTVQDITETKQAEARLQATADMLRVSEQSYRILIEHAPEAIVVLDASAGHFVDVNQNAVKLFGFNRETLLKLGPIDLSAPVQADGRITADLEPERMLQALRGETPAFEWIHRNAAGEDILCEVRLVSLPSPNRQLIRGSIIDIRERKRMERLEAGQRGFLELMAKGETLTGLMEFLARFVERESGEALCSIQLFAPEGGHLEGVVAPSLPADYRRALGQLEAGPNHGSCGTAVHRGEMVVVTDLALDPLWEKDRTLALGLGLRACTCVPVLAMDGSVLAACALYYRKPQAPGGHDLKLIDLARRLLGIAIERTRAEAQIRRFNAELEQRVQSRTAQLQAANEELEAFSYSVSHDLRAPLRHVLGFTNLLTRQPAVAADPNTKRMAEVISKAAVNMSTLIDDLLNFSRMGRAELQTEPVDLGKLVADVRRDLESGLAGRQIQWNITPLPVVLGDGAMLRQVFLNLLGNSVKYTRRQPAAKIDVTCERGEKELVFAISDNGVGFEMAYADRLFGVFQRLHRDEDFEGTGIGLANVRRIIVRHGGRTWAVGNVDQGATFYFSLPLGASARSPEEA